MADVRNLLKNEREARRIIHSHTTYTTTGKLICLLCQTQLKSESLWPGHLASSQHQARLQRSDDEKISTASKVSPHSDSSTDAQEAIPKATTSVTTSSISTGRKRKASESGDDEDERKRSKRSSEELAELRTPARSGTSTPSKTGMNLSLQEIQLPSRPATPQKTPEIAAVAPAPAVTVNEDEWAAFEAEIAAADTEAVVEATISAPAISAADLAAAQSIEESSAQRKDRHEAELEQDKEDAARKLEDEFDEMEGFEERVRKLKAKREALRFQASKDVLTGEKDDQSSQTDASKREKIKPAEDDEDEDEDSDDDDDDDDWDGFRLK